MKRIALMVLVIGLLFNFGTVSSALAEYPERPITLLVSFRAGGNVDTLARLLAKAAGDILGQPILPVNKPGRGGGIAATTLKKAKPDGYTICINVAPPYTLDIHFAKAQYTMDDFRFICSLTRGQEAYVTGSDRPWKDWKSLLQAGREKGGLTSTTFAPFQKLFLKEVSKKEGVKMTPVPTKGGAGMVPQILGGHVDFGFSGGIHHSYAKAGKMIVLAAFGEKRLKHFPDVPTLKELGYNLVLLNLVNIAAPKGVPEIVVTKLADAMSKAVKNPDVADLIENKIAWPIDYRGPGKITSALKEHSRFNKALVESLR